MKVVEIIVTRNELWKQQNNVDENYKIIKQLFNVFGFQEGINFKIDYENAIRFIRWRNGYEQVYRLVVNEENCCINVYIRSVKNNRKINENFHLYKDKDGNPLCFKGFDAWFDCIKWLGNAR